jgi:sec-independent protein translocase protein TatB
MFDITSSKLLILAIVALLVVGPKDLPILLRTLGKYMGFIRRQAAEFGAQFDEAIRETELEQLKTDFESVGREMKSTMQEGSAVVERQIATTQQDLDQALDGAPSDINTREKNDALPQAETEPAKQIVRPGKTG